MNERFSDDDLRRALCSLQAPSAERLQARLQARLAAGAPQAHDGAVRRMPWAAGLAFSLLLIAVVAGVSEYRAWQEAEELARLDELSIATMLVL